MFDGQDREIQRGDHLIYTDQDGSNLYLAIWIHAHAITAIEIVRDHKDGELWVDYLRPAELSGDGLRIATLNDQGVWK